MNQNNPISWYLRSIPVVQNISLVLSLWHVSSLIWYPTTPPTFSSLSWATLEATPTAEILLGCVHTILQWSALFPSPNQSSSINCGTLKKCLTESVKTKGLGYHEDCKNLLVHFLFCRIQCRLSWQWISIVFCCCYLSALAASRHTTYYNNLMSRY